MLLIPSRGIWGFQPQYRVEIDYGSELAKGIIEVINPALRSSLLNQDTESLAGSISVVNEAQGMAYKVTATTQYAQFGDAWSQIPTPLSLLWFYRINSTPGASNSRIGGNFTTSTSGYGIIPNNANRRGGWAAAGSNTVLTGSNRIAAGTLCMDVLTISGTSNPRSGVFYEDGIQTQTGSGNWTAPTSVQYFRVGNDNGGAAAQLASHYLAVLWARVLSAAEVWELWQNPWQLLRKQDQLIFLPSSGIALPSLSAPSFAGRVPRVTITH